MCPSHALEQGEEGHASQDMFYRRAASNLSFHLQVSLDACGHQHIMWDPVLPMTLFFPSSREILHLELLKRSLCGWTELGTFLLFPLLRQITKTPGLFRKDWINSLLRFGVNLLLLPVFFSSL